MRGDVLNLDYRAVLDASESLSLGMPWEDALRASFCTSMDEQVQDDAGLILDWLVSKGAREDQAFTERELYQDVGSLRSVKNRDRRSAALDSLEDQGWIVRFRPSAIRRPGLPGRHPGMSFRVLRVPE